MTPENFNWNDFQHAVILNAPVDEVLNYVSTPEGITKWFIGEATYTSAEGEKRQPGEQIQPGDRYHWKWLAKDFESGGEVLEVVPGKSVKLTFGSIWEVLFTVSSVENRTKLHLSQYYKDNADTNKFAHLNCCVCWTFFMTNLKSVVEHGFDLRETEEQDEALVNR